MDRLIRQITDQLVSKLPEHENYYRIQNLEDYGFPPFLIRRMHIELQWNLDESMMLPKTDWANTQSEEVQRAWQQFLNAIHAEVQLPASYARAVIETAIADVVEILVQPRKRIPEILFGGENHLSAEEMKERAELLVVYPHFARVLKAYMQRKNLDEINRDRCQEIIIQVDEKITGQYTPLQWAQMLDPLFILAGTEIDTNIFRLFFEDKNKPRVARTFDLQNDTISRATFIETLSSPDMLDYNGYEPDQPELFTGETSEEDEEPFGDDDEQEDEETVRDPFVPVRQKEDVSASAQKKNKRAPKFKYDDESVEEQAHEHEEAHHLSKEKDKTPEFAEKDDNDDEDEDEDIDRAIAKLRRVDSDDEYQQEKEQEEMGVSAKPEESVASLNDIFIGSDEEEEMPEKETETDDELRDEVINEEEPDNQGAIWERFMDEEEPAQEDYEDNGVDKPVIDLTDKPDRVDKEQKTLEHLLENERSYYVDELFGGSDQAYKEALRKVAEKEDWKSASKEIQNNVFRRNMVNIYSEPAVDFTDRLQTYFLDKKNN